MNWSQQDLSERLHVSRNYIALIETGAKKPSVRLLNQLEQLLTSVDKGSSTMVQEPHHPFHDPAVKTRIPEAGASPAHQRETSGMLDPRFQPRAEPTMQKCSEYFSEYLHRASQHEGGLGYVWRLLQKHFPLDEFGADEPTPPA